MPPSVFNTLVPRTFTLSVLLALSFTLMACDSTEEEVEDDVTVEIGCDDPGAITIPIAPTATYLLTGAGDAADPAQAVRLSDVGLQPGDRIRVERLGEFRWSRGQNANAILYGALVVFSSDEVLLGRRERERVPGALSVGIDYVSRPTFSGGLETDIPEDFGVEFESVTLTVPEGAAFIFVSPDDSNFVDNSDEDEDFRLCITKVGS